MHSSAPQAFARCLRARPQRRRLWQVIIAAVSFPVFAALADAGDHPYADWQKARLRLESRGIGIGLAYTGESATAVSGGTRRGSTYLGLAQAQLMVDGAQAVAWQGMTAFVHLIRPHGGDPGASVGDAQGVSNIAASSRGRILEAWVQQNLLDERLSLLVGRYDLNTEFYVLHTASLFLNSSFGIGPELSQTGVAGPSLYPDTALATRIDLQPRKGLHLRAALINGVPVGIVRADGGSGVRRSGDGLLFVGEASLSRPAPASSTQTHDGHAAGTRMRAGRAAAATQHDGKLAIGAWRYRAQFDHLSRTAADGTPVRESGGNGFYLIGEQLLYRDTNRSGRGLLGFAQLGFGDEDVARFAQYAGAGLVLTAPFASRPGDEAGIAVASARNGTPYMDAERGNGRAVSRTETTIELTYVARFGDRLALQPSLQYVIHPGTDPGLRNATAALLRFEVFL